MKHSFVLLLLAGIGSSGCIVVDDHNTDGPDPGRGDHGPTGRSPGDVPDTIACEIAAEYGPIDPYAGTGYSGQTDGGDQYLFVESTVDNGGDHLISVDLYNGYGAFEAGWAPGQWTLTEQETDFEACGACVYVLEGFDEETGEYNRMLMLSEGTIEIEAIDPTPESGHLTGWVRDAEFREIGVDDDGAYEVVGGCASGIEEFAFDVDVADVADY